MPENDDILLDESPEDAKQAKRSGDASGKTSGSSRENDDEGSNRVNAAKAFFRAMYAGDNVDAEQYGMNVETAKSGNSQDACSSCNNLSAQIEQLENKSGELEGLYKRMAADFENYRRRVEREKEELMNLGIQKAIEAILPALDDLDRAQGSFNENSELSNVIESIKLISERFTKCLEQIGVKRLDAVGQAFDPRLHEPVQQVKAPELPDGSVAHDLRRGYVLGDKVIRPALVNVVGHDSDSSESDNEEEAGEGDEVSES